MRILITGGEGFIATHVKRHLAPEGEIISVDIMEPRVHGDEPKTRPNWGWHAGSCPPNIFRDVDIVIHLAAQVGVADSMEDPHRYIYDNTVDTAKFFETLTMLERPPKRIIVASSMSVYGDPETCNPITERHPVAPASIYGLTKYDQERIALMYGEMLNIPTAALRFFNVYGPEQALTNPYTGVLAIFASALLRGESPTIYDDGHQTRDFIYVDDVARAVARMAMESDAHGVFNVCTGYATSVLDVANLLRKELESDIPLNIPGILRPGDIKHCVGNGTKLRSELTGWWPRPLEDGIKEYVEWLRR